MNQINASTILVFFTVSMISIGQCLAADENEESGFDCIDVQPSSLHFEALEREAILINEGFCELLSSRVPPSPDIEYQRMRQLEAFAAKVASTLTVDLDVPSLSNRGVQSDYFQSQIEDYVNSVANTGLPDFYEASLATMSGIDSDFYFGNLQDGEAITIDNSNNDDCRAITQFSDSCLSVFRDFERAIDPYQRNTNSYNAYRTRISLQGLSDAWDRYFESGRYQNSIGIGLTTLFEKRHLYQDRLVGPPIRQWFALQPNLIFENISEANDGENTDIALAIEWVGVNWWQDSVLGMPFGISLASVYSDRADIKDVGHGVMLHFDNKYTIGFADHDGNSGIYLSLDLLKLFQDKEKQWEQFRNRIR